MESVKKQRKGFTLIEMMIVIAIIGIAAALSWENIVDARKKTQVLNACEGVAVMTNKARAYALAGISGFNRTRAHCTPTSCQVQGSSNGGASWTDIESAYDLVGTQITKAGASTGFDIEYTIPYAIETFSSTTYDIQFIGDASVKKTLTTSNYKATCQ